MNILGMNTFSYGLYVLSVTNPLMQTSACLINTGMQVTSDPLQVTVTVNKENATCQALLKEGHFALTSLTEVCDMEFVGNFGFKSSREIDKFAGKPVRTTCLGDVYTPQNAAAVVAGKVVNTVDLGTHIMFVAAVEDVDLLSPDTPITYKYYHEVLKGKTPKRASAYLEVPEEVVETPAEEAQEAAGAVHKFRCCLCGYVHEYAGEELPEDFTCPICGADRSNFVRID